MANRVNWFFRQQVTQAEMDLADDYLEQGERNIVQDLLGSGFIQRLPLVTNLVTENTVPDFNVLVQRLLGRDQLGQRLTNEQSGFQGGSDLGPANPTQIVDISVDENAAPTVVAAGGNSKIISIFVEFTRKETDPRLDGNSITVNFDREESVQFNVVQSAEAVTPVPPPLRTDQLLLCDITRGFGVTSIVNANIDQSRREDFVLDLPHGPSHVETGADPVPNATPAVGGLHSAADKTKLDAIDFSAPGISALFPTQAAVEQRTNVTAPAATTLDVSTVMTTASKTPGGDNTTPGVVTAPPNNEVIMLRTNFDSFTQDPDGSVGENDKVFARLTEAAGVWTLSFFIRDETTGVETAFDMTPYAGQAIQWWTVETYALNNLPTFGKGFSVPSDQVAAEFPFPIKAKDNVAADIGAFSHIQAGNDVTLTDLANGVLEINAGSPVPVGGMMPWWRPTTATAIPTGFQICDGSLLSDPQSVFDGQNLPDMQDQFVRGINNASLGTYGGPAAPPSGGSNTHNHGGASGMFAIGTDTIVGGGTAKGVAIDPHNHAISLDNNIPSYVGLLWIIRVK